MEVIIEEKVRDTVADFIFAVETKNMITLANLLSEGGEFEITDKNGEKEVGKYQFLAWFESKLKKTVIRNSSTDQCLRCQIGNPVVFFNDGEFPRKNLPFERPRTGLMLEINNGKIALIQFCYTFLHSKNEKRCKAS